MVDLRQTQVQEQNVYDYDLDIAYKDDGDELQDPSVNDYYRSYNKKGMDEDAYRFPQWAQANHKNVRTAAKETIVMHFYPEFLADYILTLWNGADGSLQDFYEGFTLRYNNNLKKEIANQLKIKGYTVYPVLVDDRAFYAKRIKTIVRCASKANISTKIAVAQKLFNSEALNLCIGELNDIKELGYKKITASEVNNLLDYYKTIFPEDYALNLTQKIVVNPTNINKDDYGVLYHDNSISNESLKQMENMLSGNRDPFDGAYNNFGTDYGYDYIAKMRGFDGVKPEQYEIKASASSKKKLILADERDSDAIGNIPLSHVMKAISQAGQSVSRVLNTKLAVPPTPIRQIRVQQNKAYNNFPELETIKPNDYLNVYEIWKITLDNDKQDEYFAILSAKCKLNRYNKAEWEDAVYHGYFGTADEAIQNIEGVLA